jgi:hypothetical protein
MQRRNTITPIKEIIMATSIRSTTTSAGAEASTRSRSMAFIMLLLLGVQFFLGMWNNLFVTVPDAHPGTNAPEYFSGVAQGLGWAMFQSALPSLVLHVVLGILLLLASIGLIVVAFRGTERVWKIVAPIGTFGILGAAFNGASFINYGHDFSSLLMASGFLIAVVAYIVGLYVSER